MESALDPKQIVHHLLTTADKYRQFAQWIGDHETIRRILAHTDELKQRTRAMAKPEEAKIRNRGREIWEENGRPAAERMNAVSQPTARSNVHGWRQVHRGRPSKPQHPECEE
jgi:hypothetical protein